MKKLLLICSALPLLFIAACSGSAQKDTYVFPAPGTVIDSAEMPVTTDALNDFTFYVVIRADSDVAKGIYDVTATHGVNTAEGKFTMPKGAEKFKPAIRKGTNSETFIIGFYAPKDTTFYDYFEVTGQKLNIGMKYLKSYTFE